MKPRFTLAFAHELSRLGLAHTLWVAAPGAEQHHFWRATLPSALAYAATGAGAATAS